MWKEWGNTTKVRTRCGKQKSELTILGQWLVWHCQLGSVTGHTRVCFSVFENLPHLAKFRDFMGAISNEILETLLNLGATEVMAFPLWPLPSEVSVSTHQEGSGETVMGMNSQMAAPAQGHTSTGFSAE